MLPLGVSAVTVGFGFLIALDAPPLDLRTSPAIIPIAHALIAIPFVVRVMLPVLQSIDPRLREAAAVLGAAPRRVWLEVDLRIAARAALVAAGFAFAISLGEFGATLFIVRPETTTLPVAIYRLLGRPGRGELRPGDGREHDPDGAHRGVGAASSSGCACATSASSDARDRAAHACGTATRSRSTRVDLTVADHEVVCVLGPSGSGKSTLLRAIAGPRAPDARAACAGTATTSPASRRTAASSA